MPQHIQIINASTVLKDSQVELALPALQQQVSSDFAPAWGLDAQLEFVASGATPDPSAWQLCVLDNSDQAGALGYHDLTNEGLPLGKVFAGTDIQYGNSWFVTLSHELLEMMADPDINLCADNGSKLYAYEVCDAVEDDALGYMVAGVLLSDFVYPSWFTPGGEPPFDKCGHITAPFQLGPGGYISVMEIYTLGWKQINGENPMDRADCKRCLGHLAAPIGSRRSRRSNNRSLWRHSIK